MFLGLSNQGDEIGLAFFTHWREERCLQEFGVKPEGQNLFVNLNVDGRIIFKWILQFMVGDRGIGLIWLRMGRSGGV
jgi:hypothetical protein